MTKREPTYSVMFHTEMQNVRIKVQALSIVDAIVKVCEAQEVPHRAVLEARKVR